MSDTVTSDISEELREAFAAGAAHLYSAHFTTVHPFPYSEVMNEARKRYRSTAAKLRAVTIHGTRYRYSNGVLEVAIGNGWDKAFGITPQYIKELAGLIDQPYEAE